ISFSCKQNQEIEFNADKTFPDATNLTALEETEFLATLESEVSKDKNAIYAASLLFAWNEIKNAIGQPIISFENPELERMNESSSYINVLAKDEYITRVEIDLPQITAEAYFRKSLPFMEPFHKYEESFLFKKDNVESFGLFGANYNVALLKYYKNDNDFAIELIPQDEEHEILLIKTSFEQKFALIDVIDAYRDKIQSWINNRTEKNSWKYYLSDEDQLKVPIIEFNIAHNYTNIEKSFFSTTEMPHQITKMFQQTAFILNENGAEVESYAEIVEECVEEIEEEDLQKPKKLFFDSEFIILLKRRDNSYPYFAMYVANAELMKKMEK
ncbi:MAG: hypothetical protein HN431_18830, partial [Bacteroidetes bacterium]|nr:hypothetical protein [Bacteroidota bacterium]